jgi:hypothetical protein
LLTKRQLPEGFVALVVVAALQRCLAKEARDRKYLSLAGRGSASMLLYSFYYPLNWRNIIQNFPLQLVSDWQAPPMI